MIYESFEKIFLLLFIGVFLFFSIGELSDNRISHDFPYRYYASDAFLHLGNAENVKLTGFYKNHPPYISAGFEDVAPLDPPGMDYLSSIMSYFTKIQVYDILPLLAVILTLFGVLAFYCLLRLTSPNIAILSLPLSILLCTKKFFLGIAWGHFDTYAAFAFFIVAIWLFSKLDRKFILIPLSIVISAAFMTHGGEAIFIGGFAVVYFIVRYFTTGIEGAHIWKISLSGLVAIILSFPFLKVFYFVYAQEPGQLFTLNFSTNPSIPALFDFGWMLIFIGVGLILSFLLLKEKNNIIITFSMFIFVLSFLNYIGFSKAFDLRWFWPASLSTFFGVSLYFGTRLIKGWKTAYSILVSIVFLVILISVFHTTLSGSGLMNLNHWDMFKWIENNTATDSKVYYFYGDTFGQTAILYNGKRVSYYIDLDDYVNTIKENKITRFYESSIIIEVVGGLPYSTGIFSFGHHLDKIDVGGNMDICSFDYLVFDKVSVNQIFSIYNVGVRDILLNKTWTEMVYDNPVASIVKNNKKGEDCIYSP